MGVGGTVSVLSWLVSDSEVRLTSFDASHLTLDAAWLIQKGTWREDGPDPASLNAFPIPICWFCAVCSMIHAFVSSVSFAFACDVSQSRCGPSEGEDRKASLLGSSSLRRKSLASLGSDVYFLGKPRVPRTEARGFVLFN